MSELPIYTDALHVNTAVEQGIVVICGFAYKETEHQIRMNISPIVCPLAAAFAKLWLIHIVL